MLDCFLALVFQLAGASPAKTPAAARYRVEATPAWEVELGAPLAGPLQGLELAPERLAVLVPLEASLELRAAADGALIWRRLDLAGAGVQSGIPWETPQGPVIGWAGFPGHGPPAFLLLSAQDGSTRLATPLEGRPVAPPLPVKGASGGRWFVALENGLVSVLDEAGRPAGPLRQLDGKIQGPLIALEEWVLAVSGEDRRLVGVGHGGQRRPPKEVLPESLATFGNRIGGATGRTARVWKCRVRPGRGPSCREDWHQDLGGLITAAPLAAGGLVLFPCWDTFLYAFHPETGHLAWRVRAGHRLSSSPQLWGPLAALLPESTATVIFLDLANGAPAGKIEGPAERIFLGPPARAGKTLLVPFLQGAEDFPRLAAYSIRLLGNP